MKVGSHVRLMELAGKSSFMEVEIWGESGAVGT